MQSFLKVTTLSLFASLFASNASAANYQEKLGTLRARLELDLPSRTGLVAKAAIVDRLYEAVTGTHAASFGPGRLVRGVQVFDSTGLEAEALELKLRLRDHKLKVTVSGQGWAEQLARLPEEKQLLDQVHAQEAALKRRLPNLRFYRHDEPVGLPFQVTTNGRYLDLLRTIEATLASHPNVEAQLRGKYLEVAIDDSLEVSPSTSSFRVTDYVNSKGDLVLRFGKRNTATETLGDPAAFLVAATGLAGHGFKGARTFFAKEAQLTEGLTSLNAYFSENPRANEIRGYGVREFVIDADYANRDELLSEDGRLTVGPTREDVQRVMDILF